MVDNTQLGWICGLSAVSLQRCAHESLFSQVTPRLTRYSRYSGKFPEVDLSDQVLINSRLLGTPNDHDWPGVTSFPDFKPSFPKWTRDPTRALVNNLDDNGLDLLDAMLVYDPAGRISAKQACMHPYFEAGSSAYSGRGKPNGYH